MLFKTVYGPELECVYEYLKLYGPQDRGMLYRAFVPRVGREMGPRANLDDAIVFLTSAKMIVKNEVGVFGAAVGVFNFRLQLLQNLRQIQLGSLESSHPMDPWYLGLVDMLFVRPGRTVAFALHKLANTLEVPEILSEEKVGAWRRVLEFIGLGSRLASGFLCSYQPELVLEVISQWEEEEGPIQSLLENHIGKFFPWEDEGGDVAPTLGVPLKMLARWGYINLGDRQDLPNRSYFGDEKIKWVRKGGGGQCFHVSRKAV